MTNDEIVYKIISSEGHTEETATAHQAVVDIRSLVENESKWLYVDKVHIASINNINEQLLRDAEEIMLTNTQAGG